MQVDVVVAICAGSCFSGEGCPELNLEMIQTSMEGLGWGGPIALNRLNL